MNAPLKQVARAAAGAVRSASVPTRKLVPPFTEETARAKVKAAQNLWNTCDPEKISLAYTEGKHTVGPITIFVHELTTDYLPADSIWRNRTSFLQGRPGIVELLRAKWAKEKEYILRKELFSYSGNRIAVQFWYEYRDSSDGMKWKRCCESLSSVAVGWFAELVELVG